MQQEQEMQEKQSIQIIQIEKKQAEERVWAIDWHPSGKLLASVGSSKKIKLWKFSQHNKSLQLVQTLQTDHTRTIRNINFSHDGNKIATASFDAEISIWVRPEEQNDLSSDMYQHLQNLSGHESQVKCVKWSPTDKKLASCSRDKNIWVWQFDQISYEYVCENVLEGHTQDVKFVNWINQQKIISCGYDDSIRIWDMQDDDFVCTSVLTGHTSIVWAITVFNQTKQLVSVSEDCSIILWNQSDKQLPCYTLSKQYHNHHMFPIYSCDISRDSQYLLTGAGDNQIKVLNLHNQETTQVSHDSDVNCVKFHVEGKLSIFASCSDDQTIRLWHYSKGSL